MHDFDVCTGMGAIICCPCSLCTPICHGATHRIAALFEPHVYPTNVTISVPKQILKIQLYLNEVIRQVTPLNDWSGSQSAAEVGKRNRTSPCLGNEEQRVRCPSSEIYWQSDLKWINE